MSLLIGDKIRDGDDQCYFRQLDWVSMQFSCVK